MKKRFLSILLSLCLIITLLPSHALAATNRLANPGGEAVAENTYGMLCQNGWTEENTPYRGYSYTGFDGTGTTKGIVLAPKSGDYFMGFFAASGSCYQDITVTDSMKDDVYSLTGYLAAKNAASTSGATSAVLKIEQIDSSDNVILNTASEASVSAETGWTQKTLTGTINAGAAKLRVSIAGVLAESINSLAAFDDLSLLVTPSVTSVITKAATANGSFTVSAESASTGKTVTISPAPDINYVVDTISVTKTGEPGTTVTVNDNNTFTMPAYPVTVTVTYKAAALTGTVTISGSLILDPLHMLA